MKMEEAALPKIMIVDDEPANTLLLERLFEMVGTAACRSTNDSREALALYQDYAPDLVLLDLSMPYLDGFQVLEQLRGATAPGDYCPILVLTADITERTKEQALAGGANDFLTKPFSNSEVVLRARNLLAARQLHLELQQSHDRLEATVAERTSALTAALADLNAAQQRVVEQERLRALGAMASGVAHDFNNALSIILGYGELVLGQCQNCGAASAAAQMRTIITTAQDAAKIVRRLREFHRSADDDPERPVDLHTLVEQAIAITEPRWKTQAMGRGVAITTALDLEPVPPILGHAHELREVLTNLIFNAVDAMPAGGALTFTTRADGGSVLLSLADSGTGMSEEVRQRCLEPFFSTKGEGGSGLGLAMVYGIIQRHRGLVEIESQPGCGTTFLLRFPAAGDTAADGTASAACALDRPLRVLVVDDQEVIREIVELYLTSDAHAVTTAGDGEEALSVLDGEPYDLVITDQAMPGMNGEQLALAVKERHPGTRVILLTGFGGGIDGDRPPGIDLIVGKPVSHDDLRRAIDTVMR